VRFYATSQLGVARGEDERPAAVALCGRDEDKIVYFQGLDSISVSRESRKTPNRPSRQGAQAGSPLYSKKQ